ncbi:MAG: hypothetical protein ACRYFU_04460 [Janthinobacterium lividum]
MRYFVALLSLAIPSLSHATELQRGELLPPPAGLVCMMPNMTPDQTASYRVGVPVRSAPDPASHIDGYAAAVVIAKPSISRNGFTEVLWPTGAVGWVVDRALIPWANHYVPGRHCTPTFMANGRLGYDFN